MAFFPRNKSPVPAADQIPTYPGFTPHGKHPQIWQHVRVALPAVSTLHCSAWVQTSFFFFLGGPENSTDLKGSLAHDVAKKKDLFINAVRTGTYQGNTGGPNRWHDEYT